MDTANERANEVINDWRPEVSALMRSLEENGFTLMSVNNGEENTKRESVSWEGFVAAAIATDEAYLYVRSKAGKQLSLFLVLGNSPGELVADYAADDDALEYVTEKHNQAWEGTEQLKCRAVEMFGERDEKGGWVRKPYGME